MTEDSWTHEDVPDQTGKTVIVTGANSGIGFEATKTLTQKGAHVIMACRNLDRARSAKNDILATLNNASLKIMKLDLADLSSVHSFVDKFKKEESKLHILCNNAGTMAIPRSETADGFEMQFGVNHLGHFALTGLLLDKLKETESETRVVTHSSGAHKHGDIKFKDLQSRQEYKKWGAYAQSKLANLLFAYELDRRLKASNTKVISTACHPGYAATNLQERGPKIEGSKLRLWIMKLANSIFAQSARKGALPMLYAATANDVKGGDYIGPGGLLKMRGKPEKQSSSEKSYDPDLARRLWEVSEDLTGVSFDLPSVKS